MKKNEIEDLFKKSFENYEAEVSPGVWKNVRIGLKWGGLALLFTTLLNKIGTGTIIAILSSAAIISTVAIMNKKNNIIKETQPTAIETKIAPVTTIEKPASVVNSGNKNQLNTIEEKEENKKTLADDKMKVADSGQKTGLTSANTIIEPTKKDNKKNEPVINKFSEEPIASISASPAGGTAPLIVDLANNGTGKTNQWTYSDGKNDKSASNPVHVFETPGIYSVILTSTNADGKTDMDSIKVEVKEPVSSVPTEFSPNGDGVLDVFIFQSKNIAFMKAKIFDKKGTVVYKSEGTDAKWDGKDPQGKEVKEGRYFYLVNAEGINGKKYEQKGSINLTR